MTVTFSPEAQAAHREEFIKNCRQNAWGAACNADWVSQTLDKLLKRFTALKKDDDELIEKIHAKEIAPDYHTVENRNDRKAMNQRRAMIAQDLKAITEHAERGRQSLMQYAQSIDSNLALANHAETWEWKEGESKNSTPDPKDADKPTSVDLKNEIKKGSTKSEN